MTIAGSGYVGIGSTVPRNALDIGTTQGIHIAAGTPTNTGYALYNVGGTLTWNGSALAAGGSGTVNSGTQYQIAYYPNSGSTTTIGGDANIKTDSNNDLLVTSGNLGIGTSSNPGVPLGIAYTSTATSGNAVASYINSTASPASTSTATYRGIDSEVYYKGTAASTTAYTVGVFGYAQDNTAYNAGVIEGMMAQSENNSGVTLSKAYGLDVSVNNNSGTITQAVGVYIHGVNSGTAITTNYGEYIDTIAGTTTYGLYQASSSNQNYFAGNVGIGSTTPANALDVNGQMDLASVGGAAAPTTTSANYSEMAGNSNNATLVAGANYYGPANGSFTMVSGTDLSAGTRSIVSRAATVQNLYYIASAANSAGKTNTITVMKNGVAQNLTCSVTAVTTCNDTNSGHAFTVVAGDELGIRIATGSATNTAVKHSWSIELSY